MNVRELQPAISCAIPACYRIAFVYDKLDFPEFPQVYYSIRLVYDEEYI